MQQRLIAPADLAGAVALQDGLHNVIQTPQFQQVMNQAIASFFGGVFEPNLMERLRRFIAAGDRNDARSFSVGTQPVKILERDPSRVYALVYVAGPLAVAQSQTDVDNSATGAAAAIAATLPAAAGATTFITGFEVTGTGATAGSIITITVTGILGGTKSYVYVVPAGVGAAAPTLTVEFSRPIPASALNTAIAVNVPSFGAGNTNAAVTAHGFQQVAAVAAPTVAVGGRQVTTGVANDPSAGIPIPVGSVLPFTLNDDIGELWAVASQAGVDVRVLDVAGGI